jgi:hypothetical protein
MAIKPIGSGLTLFADYPAAALSSPRLAAKSIRSRSLPNAPGKPQDGPPRPCSASMPPAGRHKAQPQSAF